MESFSSCLSFLICRRIYGYTSHRRWKIIINNSLINENFAQILNDPKHINIENTDENSSFEKENTNGKRIPTGN